MAFAFLYLELAALAFGPFGNKLAKAEGLFFQIVLFLQIHMQDVLNRIP